MQFIHPKKLTGGIIIMEFMYSIPTKVAFGKGQIAKLPEFVSEFGNNVLLVYGGGSIKKIGIYDEIYSLLGKDSVNIIELSGVEPNPRITTVNKGIKLCRDNNVDVILAVGGGSTIDCSKAIAAGYYYDGDAWDIISKHLPVDKALPIITILTLAATGSEMDMMAVISNDDTQDKMAFGAEAVIPKYSILDPSYTYSVPKYQTASGTADIMSHIFEVYLNGNKPLDIQKSMMESVLKTCIKYGPIACAEPENEEARANLMWASSWAINGFISYGVEAPWPCHAMEHQLSAYYNVTHGHGLAILTPEWMRYILNEITMSRFVDYGINVFGIDSSLKDEVIANLAIDKTKEVFDKMELTDSLQSIGIEDDRYFADMAEKACGGLNNCNPPLFKEDVIKIYEGCSK